MPFIEGLISCVMISRGDLGLARFGIASFLAQTYLDTELVVVSADEMGELEPYVASLGDPRLQFHKSSQKGLSIGNLRNIGIGFARGEYIAQWDDDDLSDPARLAASLKVLHSTGAAAVFLEHWLMISPFRGWIALGGSRAWEGSMLARRDALPIYPDFRLSEDAAFARMLARHHRIALLHYPELYLYFETGSNSWPSGHFQNLLAGSSRSWTGAEYESKIAELSLRTPVRGYVDFLLARAAKTEKP